MYFENLIAATNFVSCAPVCDKASRRIGQCALVSKSTKNQSQQRANNSAAFSDMIASILNSKTAESLDEDREATFIDKWQKRPVLYENVSK